MLVVKSDGGSPSGRRGGKQFAPSEKRHDAPSRPSSVYEFLNKLPPRVPLPVADKFEYGAKSGLLISPDEIAVRPIASDPDTIPHEPPVSEGPGRFVRCLSFGEIHVRQLRHEGLRVLPGPVQLVEAVNRQLLETEGIFLPFPEVIQGLLGWSGAQFPPFTPSRKRDVWRGMQFPIATFRPRMALGAYLRHIDVGVRRVFFQ